MAKLHTPAIERFQHGTDNIPKKVCTWREAGRRLRRNKMAIVGLVIILFLSICAIMPELVAPYGYDDQDYSNQFLAPSIKHRMGTDNFGRDIFSKIIYGARVSMLIGFVAVTMAAIVGGTLGALAAFYGGKIDDIILRFVDIQLAIPSILLAI